MSDKPKRSWFQFRLVTAVLLMFLAALSFKSGRGTAAAVFGLLQLFLRRTRYGLIVRAGVENRAMVTALGIDVRGAFTLVFAIGGAAAALAGALAGLYFGSITPGLGGSLLIFAFIVVVIGGTGSVLGCALAAALSVCTSAIADNDLDAGVCAQPIGEHLGSAVVEQVNGTVRFKVEQQRPVPAWFLSQRDVIDT